MFVRFPELSSLHIPDAQVASHPWPSLAQVSLCNTGLKLAPFTSEALCKRRAGSAEVRRACRRLGVEAAR